MQCSDKNQHGGKSVGFRLSPAQNLFVSNVVVVCDIENASEAPLVEHVQLVDNVQCFYRSCSVVFMSELYCGLCGRRSLNC